MEKAAGVPRRIRVYHEVLEAVHVDRGDCILGVWILCRTRRRHSEALTIEISYLQLGLVQRLTCGCLTKPLSKSRNLPLGTDT